MNILVTGGAGYVGSIVSEELVRQGHTVVVFDNLCYGHRAAVHPEAAFVQGDLADRAAVKSLFDTRAVEAVMHFASHTLVGESMEQPFLYVGDNVTNGLNLLQEAVAHGVRRFILSSSANLFDEPERIPIDEQEQIVPGSPYGESKYILERILHWLDQIYGFRYAALRYFNAAGAAPSGERGEDHDPETHLIPLVLQVALGQRDRIVIFGDDYPTRDGTCVRDYIHVQDLADAHILALEKLGETKKNAFNLGNGEGYSVLEVVSSVERVTGKKVPAVDAPRRPGDPARLVASSVRARKILGWRPKRAKLDEIVGDAWAWKQRFPQGYGD